MRILAKPCDGRSNPVNRILYEKISGLGVAVEEFTPLRMLLCRYDILHVHWPENVLRSSSWGVCVCRFMALMFALSFIRFRQKKVIWTAHNLESHERKHPWLERVFWGLFFRRLDAVITLTDVSAQLLADKSQAANCIYTETIPHGHYEGQYSASVSRAEARAHFGISTDALVLAHVGLIRPYKKVERLIALAKEDPAIHVLIGGKVFESDYRDYLIDLVRETPNVSLVLERIPDEQLQLYMKSADFFVLPYDEITNSGSAIMALSFGVPVLAPGLEVLSEMRNRFEGQWFFSYDVGRLSLEVVRLAQEKSTSRETDRVEWGDMEWSCIAEKTVKLYQKLL